MRPSNPFSTRFTRPGALPPLAPDGREIDTHLLLQRLAVIGGSGTILGPHGSGKSTLMRALEATLHAEGRLSGCVRLGEGWCQDVLAVIRGLTGCRRGKVLCVDGWERLGRAAAAGLRVVARILHRDLLVTSHHSTSLPTLVETSTDPELLVRIVERLPDNGGAIRRRDVVEAFDASSGNLREALFALYDEHERLEGLRNAEVRS